MTNTKEPTREQVNNFFQRLNSAKWNITDSFVDISTELLGLFHGLKHNKIVEFQQLIDVTKISLNIQLAIDNPNLANIEKEVAEIIEHLLKTFDYD